MRALLPVMAGCLLLACGGNVVLDGGTGGAGATGSGGAGGASCTALLNAFEAALAAATVCEAGAPPSVCMAEGVDVCGCPVILNSTGNVAAEEIAAYKAMQAAGCSPAVPCPAGCPVVDLMFAQCLPGATSGYQCGEGPG
jgi:hypothetical protein